MSLCLIAERSVFRVIIECFGARRSLLMIIFYIVNGECNFVGSPGGTLCRHGADSLAWQRHGYHSHGLFQAFCTGDRKTPEGNHQTGIFENTSMPEMTTLTEDSEIRAFNETLFTLSVFVRSRGDTPFRDVFPDKSERIRLSIRTPIPFRV